MDGQTNVSRVGFFLNFLVSANQWCIVFVFVPFIELFLACGE